ncbi:NRDE family protein [Ruficoccus sp. ZRK36]|uniref:NRDE family protein n=1 Tax=Ruficoccus sp. ZRK36 TaxID=2866311 RepID=UPI001C72C01F|nr:NRDE family protein [Ruficoccus sp. ZRK36]QYY37342.1 NRDE family protein [Ruficoccus sp. ZRK36]
MCTVTWWSTSDGYELYFNRDEFKTRLPGLPPEELELAGVRYLSPRDADEGGTWLLVNEVGLCVCLINQHPLRRPVPRGERVSRGHLVRGMASCLKAREVAERLRGCDLFAYRPFQMIAVEPGGSGTAWTWDGHELAESLNAHEAMPFTSSSYLSEQIIRHRRERFAQIVAQRGDPSPEDLLAFHREHNVEAGAFSVCMQRDDAETVSLAQVVVRPDTIAMTYSQKVPGQPAFAQPVRASLKPRSCLS